MLAALAGLLAVLSALVVARRRRRESLPARAVIVSPSESTTISRGGAVRSIQCADLTLSSSDLERLWTPTNLENLARTYWRFLSRVTLGLIRVAYTPEDRRVMLIGKRLTLLRFDPPEYVIEPGHGSVRWGIIDGLLVARAGRGKGYLSIDARRCGPDGAGREKVRIEVEVSNFYPSIAAGFSTPVYQATQSAIHVLVTHAFLRSLATLSLARSRVGRLRALARAAQAQAQSHGPQHTQPKAPASAPERARTQPPGEPEPTASSQP